MKVGTNLLLVFAGGGLGSIIRYYFSILFKSENMGFPIPTFMVNVLGCLIIGISYNLINAENQSLRLFFLIGFLGGFTTFSTFGNETLQLFTKGQMQTGFLYVFLSNICGFGAVYLGTKIASLFS